ncbi:MAG: hypothetical protein WCW68_06065 [Methanothrix sp.]
MPVALPITRSLMIANHPRNSPQPGHLLNATRTELTAALPPACVLPRPVSGDGSSQGSGRRHPQGSRARRTSACWPPWARELDVFKINILR